MKWLAGTLLFAVIVTGVWHGRGLLIALAPVPAAQLRSMAVEKLVVPIGVRAEAGDREVRIDVRVFVGANWKHHPRDAKFPALLYMPAWGGRATDNDVLLERLGGEGYLVFAIDDVAFDALDPRESEATRAARTPSMDLSSPDGIAGFVQRADRKADLAVEKMSAVLDGIMSRRSAQFSDLLAKVDPARIAVMGFSFGGAAATEALKRDPRIVAGINLEGWIYGRMASFQVDKPYLMLGSTNAMPLFALGVTRRNIFAMNDLHFDRIRRQLERPDSRFVEISGTLHGDFSDGLHGAGRWTQWRPWHPPLADPKIVREKVDGMILGFLAQHVKAAGKTDGSGAPAIDRKAP